MSEIGLGIGCERRTYSNWEREWLYWYDRDCVRYPSTEERAQQAEAIAEQQKAIAEQQKAIAQQERQQKLQECQQKEKLANYLRSIGINPDEI